MRVDITFRSAIPYYYMRTNINCDGNLRKNKKSVGKQFRFLLVNIKVKREPIKSMMKVLIDKQN